MGCGSGLTCWRRLRDWQQAGVWHRLHTTLLDRLGEADRIDWSRASIDSAAVPAKGGALGTRLPPKRSARIQRIAANWAASAMCWSTARAPRSPSGSPANVHDGQLLTALVEPSSPSTAREARQADRASVRTSCTRTRRTARGPTAGRCASAASRHGSPDRASSRVSGWGATAGWSNGRWPGWAASADWPSATSGGPTSTWPSWISAVPCCASPPSSTSDAARRSQLVIELAASA